MLPNRRSNGFLYFANKRGTLVNGALSNTPGASFYKPGGLGVVKEREPVLVPYPVRSIYQVKPLMTPPNDKYKVQTRPDSEPVVKRWANMFGPEILRQSQFANNYMVDHAAKEVRKRQLEGHGEGEGSAMDTSEQSEPPPEAPQANNSADESEPPAEKPKTELHGQGEPSKRPPKKAVQPSGRTKIKAVKRKATPPVKATPSVKATPPVKQEPDEGTSSFEKPDPFFNPLLKSDGIPSDLKKRKQLKALVMNPVKMNSQDYKKSLAQSKASKIKIEAD